MTLIRTSAPGYRTQSLDTSIEAEQVQFGLWRTLPFWKKAELISGWTKGCWEMCLLAIRYRYPNADPAFIRREFTIRTLGEDFQSIESILSVYPFLWEQPLMLTDPISLALVVADILNNLEIPYLVGGSVASSLLGEPRSTQDIDLVADLRPEKVESLIQAVQPRFSVSETAVREAIRSQESFNLIDNESLGKIDIFILKDQPFNQAEFQRRQARVIRQDPDRVIVLPTSEDIILQKLIWYRMGRFKSEKQWRDILGVMKLQGEQLDKVYLNQWAETLQLTELLAQALQSAGLSD
ncbi:hypothetical protein H6S82_19160 [Planktothrix sp. FACHB-1355]|uniref:Uncharacterized protein n=1 Tax=Aerosakkonema funiforme FACHB-1375 TaxID=2949571 RepID=A0A926ZKP1_9CYAN|nr:MULTISPECIES: hypothetical protein [Oscillatoriales]MBD2185587.1 hypothetical protein [Aerosakkonema funiforme FACHB-1375]MBD3560953.1 hypothetical protein [Planktothrix sp. FACHB-1355]